MPETTLKRVVVAGGTGLIGRRLVETLIERGVQVMVLSRHPERNDPPAGAKVHNYDNLPGTLDGADAVFNLAGASIAGRRWSKAYKHELVESRTGTTARLVEGMRWGQVKPKVLVNASAVGYYGPHRGEVVDEKGAKGRSFLAKLCAQWEAEADKAAELGVRVVKLRTGVVLAREGGALPKLALPVKLFQGAKLGHGHQGFSWIHIDDLVAMYLEAATNEIWTGALNATSPRPVNNETLTRMIAKQLHRPVLPVPGFITAAAVKLLVGEMASELLEGAFVYPRRAQALGFLFRFEKAEDALADLL